MPDAKGVRPARSWSSCRTTSRSVPTPARPRPGHNARLRGVAVERDVVNLNLMIRSDNAAVRDFYAAIGYGVDDVVVMSRRLE